MKPFKNREEPVLEGDPHHWKLKWWGRSFRLCPRISFFAKEGGLHGKDEWLPEVILPPAERAYLEERFHSRPEQDFEGPHFHADLLPTMTRRLTHVMDGLRPVEYYCFKGSGCVPLHSDPESDIDHEGRVPFVVVMKTKVQHAEYHPQGNPGLHHITALSFVAHIPGQGMREEDEMEPGAVVIFDSNSTHGLVTSMGYYLLCGLAEEVLP